MLDMKTGDIKANRVIESKPSQRIFRQ